MFGTRGGGVGHNFCHSFDGLYLKESLQEFLNPLSIIPPWLKFLSGIPAAIPSGTAHQKNERSCGLPPPPGSKHFIFLLFSKGHSSAWFLQDDFIARFFGQFCSPFCFGENSLGHFFGQFCSIFFRRWCFLWHFFIGLIFHGQFCSPFCFGENSLVHFFGQFCSIFFRRWCFLWHFFIGLILAGWFYCWFFGQFCSPFCFGKMLSLLIMFFCWLNISDQFFLTFGSLIFVRFMSYAQIFGGLPLPLVSYIKADFWGATPP